MVFFRNSKAWNKLLFFLLIGISLACHRSPEILEIESEKDLIPEGIACTESGQLFLSSLHKRKIVAYSLGDGILSDFIAAGANGFLQGVGMEVRGDTLYALSSALAPEGPESRLQIYDIPSRQLLQEFRPVDSLGGYWNDLAIHPNGDCYITDTAHHRVIRIDANERQTVFLEDPTLRYPNGIALSGDGRKLFVTSLTEGIRIVDLFSGKIRNPRHSGTSNLGLDGLKYYAGSLYAIQNGQADKRKHGLIRIPLENSEWDAGVPIPILINHPAMNIPTTFCICDGKAYILANSQLERLDQQTNRILQPDSLTSTFLIPYTL